MDLNTTGDREGSEFVCFSRLCVVVLIGIYLNESEDAPDQKMGLMRVIVRLLREDGENPAPGSSVLKAISTSETGNAYTLFLQRLRSWSTLEDLASFLENFRSLIVLNPVDTSEENGRLCENSLLGSFVMDFFCAFSQLSFEHQCDLFEQVVTERYQLTKSQEMEIPNAPQTSEFSPYTKLETLIRFALTSGNYSKAIKYLYALYDASYDENRDEILLALASVYTQVGNFENALFISQEYITLARKAGNSTGILRLVLWLDTLTRSYPNLELPPGIGSMSLLHNWLLEAAKKGPKHTECIILLFSAYCALDTAHPVSHVISLVSQSCQIAPHLQAQHRSLQLQFHLYMIRIWYRLGKGQLAQSHMSVLNVMLRDLDSDFDFDARLDNGTTLCELLLCQGLEYEATASAIDTLARIAPSKNDNVSLFKIYEYTRLLLDARLAIKQHDFTQASNYLHFLDQIPDLDFEIVQKVKQCRVQLLLAAGSERVAHSEAMESARKLQELNVGKVHDLSLRLLGIRALIALATPDSESLQNEALSLARELHTQSLKIHDVPHSLEAEILVSVLLLDKGEYRECLALCDKLAAPVFDLGCPKLVCELSAVYADCVLGLYQNNGDKSLVELAAQYVEHALDSYVDCELNALHENLARLHSALGDVLGRPVSRSPEPTKPLIWIQPSSSEANDRKRKCSNGETGAPPKRLCLVSY